jgi:hypothetical protein
LFTLLVVAAGPLHLDQYAGEPSPDRLGLLAGGLLATAIAWCSHVALTRWRIRTEEPPHDSRLLERGLSLPSWFWIGPATVALVWIASAISMAGGPVHLPLLAAIVGVIAFGFATRTLLSIPSFHMRRPALAQTSLCVTAGIAVGIGAFWFVSMGIWQGERPLSGAWLAGTTVAVFAGTFVTYVSTGLALANGLPKARRESQFVLAREATQGYVGLDGMNLGAVLIIGVALPLYAATRDQELHASSLNVIASMVFLPGLVAAVLWGVRNWRTWEHLNLEKTRAGAIVWPVLDLADGDWQRALNLEQRRAARSGRHLQLNRYSMLALLSCGLAYLADVLLR